MRRFYDLGVKPLKGLIREALVKKGFYKVGVRNALREIKGIEEIIYMREVTYKGGNTSHLVYASTSDYKESRKLVEKGKIDLLEDMPFIFFKHPLDYVLIKLMAENNIAMSFNLKSFLKLDEGSQIKYVQKGMKLIKLANKYNVKVIVVSGAERKQDLRYARDLAAFYYLMDEDVEKSLKAVSDNVEWLLEKARLRSKRIAPGIYIEGENA